MQRFKIELTEEQSQYFNLILPKQYVLKKARGNFRTYRTGKGSSDGVALNNGDVNNNGNCMQSKSDNDSEMETKPQSYNQGKQGRKAIKGGKIGKQSNIGPEQIDQRNIVTHTKIIDKRKKLFIEILEQIQNKKSSSIFIEPVDPILQGIPTYFKVIKEPMDIFTMKQKARLNKYPKFQLFQKDLALIVSNCLKFNTGNQKIIKLANKFQKDYKSVLEKYKTDIDQILFQQMEKQVKPKQDQGQLKKKDRKSEQKQKQINGKSQIDSHSNKKQKINKKKSQKMINRNISSDAIVNENIIVDQKEQKSDQLVNGKKQGLKQAKKQKSSSRKKKQMIQQQSNNSQQQLKLDQVGNDGLVGQSESDNKLCKDKKDQTGVNETDQKNNQNQRNEEQDQDKTISIDKQQAVEEKQIKSSTIKLKSTQYKKTIQSGKNQTPKPKKYSYDQRLNIISRIRKLDKKTMAELFKTIDFHQGEVMDFKVLSDDKVGQIDEFVRKYEKIYEEKVKWIGEKNNEGLKSRQDDGERNNGMFLKEKDVNGVPNDKQNKKKFDSQLQIEQDEDYND